MRELSISTSTGSYDVVVGPGLLGDVGRLMRQAGLDGQVRLIADSEVYRLHGSSVEYALLAAGYVVRTRVVPAGEASKSLDVVSGIYDWLVDEETERRDLVVALGGGVIGDLAGFVAATFLRGLRFVQLPTSLLAQVDSSVGGKVAVNHGKGKNLIGAFYPPSLVVADTITLGTLPTRELSAALAEIAKMGMILDGELVCYLEENAGRLLAMDQESLEWVVSRTVGLKAGVVEQDEKEGGLRRILNYGHTLGHAVELCAGYGEYRHGEAVGVGMVAAASIAERLGLLDPAIGERQRSLLLRLGAPVACPGLVAEEVVRGMRSDKKKRSGRLAWVLLEGIGKVAARQDVPDELVSEVAAELCVPVRA